MTRICFSKKTLLKPLFLLCFLGTRLDTHPKKKILLITESYFWGILWFFLFLFFFVSFCFFGEGFKGQVRWPEGPPHLAINHPYLYFCFFLLFAFAFFGGFKGQVMWPEGPPHLALNPPYLFLGCLLVFFFVSLFFPFPLFFY